VPYAFFADGLKMAEQRQIERIVFLDRSILPEGVVLRRPRFPHEWQEYLSTTPGEVIPRLQGATVALTNRVKIGAHELDSLPTLRMIGVAATGYDIIDVAACERRGIIVANLRDWCTASVAEHVFALILALRRQILRQNTLAKGGVWQSSIGGCLVTQPFASDLRGSTLGIVGAGAIGSYVAKLGGAFGMDVIRAERKNATSLRHNRSLFEDMLRSSDIVSLHCPLTRETRDLIGERELRLMQSHGILINCARGGLVDSRALAKALRERWIAGAGLDGLNAEPPREGSPLLELDIPNLVLTPHAAWASQQAMAAFSEQLIANIESFVQGRPHNSIA
jgi:glycerate dehydrogenase